MKLLRPLQIIVVEDMCAGLKTAQIAERLQISVNTVQNIVSTIMLKMNCTTRAEVTAKAVAMSIVNQHEIISKTA
jgi:DNA-binding NarL/FixJ family response regulator